MLFRQDPPHHHWLTLYYFLLLLLLLLKLKGRLDKKKKRNHPIFSFLMMTVRKLMKFKTKKEQMKCALTIDRLPSSSLSHARVHFF